ncbi:Nbs-lrr resistance protein [Rhynchospora pubera]|uniref:Nbs-lrr resistance protein n=1 Tax=Rhynchospora pubera TaxID=906938 RepID=A0AAV8DBK6_9POAL|nr:Nbs-lrr resistance protein [Rhynchospora pubera]
MLNEYPKLYFAFLQSTNNENQLATLIYCIATIYLSQVLGRVGWIDQIIDYMASIFQLLRDVWDVVDKLAQKLQPCDPQEIRESIESLSGKLRLLKPFLEDSIPHDKDKIQMQLENDLKGLVLEIETLINNFHRECQQNLPNQGSEKLYKKIYLFCKRFLAKITQPTVEARFEVEVRKLKRKVRDFEINIKRYGRNFGERTYKRRKLNPIDNPEIFGFDTDIEKIVGWLCDGQVVDRAVVSIVGIGGGGKSTITKKVCNRNEVTTRFGQPIWINIAPNYVLFDTLREMAQNLGIEVSNMNEGSLGKAISEELEEKERYLVVFDNVWLEEFWREIAKFLPNKKNGSRVIITTRLNNVAMMADKTYPPYKLPLLNDDEILEIFLKNVDPKKQHCLDTSPLHSIAKEFAAYCKGLPLAVVVLSGLVATRPYNFHEWRKLSKTISWNVDGRACIDIIAKSSYENLPLAEKLCFLYLAAFPGGNAIEVKSLCRLWVSEDLIQPEERRTLEETAENILNDLLQRNLVQVSDRFFVVGPIQEIVVHDILREFAVHEAQKLEFLMVCSKPDDWERCSKARRVAIHCSLDLDELSLNCVNRNVQSLLIFSGGSKPLKLDCSKFRELRVLMCMKRGTVELQGYKGASNLRYLQSGAWNLKGNEVEFGEWVRGMKCLETLDLKETMHGDLSEWIWQAKTLRHVLLHSSLDWHGSLAATHGTLASARVKNLQTMTGVRWSRSWDSGFPDLSNVRELQIRIHRGIHRGEIERFLHGLENLDDLWITGYIAVLQEIDWKDFPCYGSLKSLTLTNSIEDTIDHNIPLPLFQLRDGMFPSNLTRLSLEVGEFGSDLMPELEKLKLLKALWIQGLDSQENEEAVRRIRCSSGGFEQLEFLCLRFLRLKEWEIEPDAMPMLKWLQVISCDPLRLPPELTDRLSSLQMLVWKTNNQAYKDVIHNIYEQKPNLRPNVSWATVLEQIAKK